MAPSRWDPWDLRPTSLHQAGGLASILGNEGPLSEAGELAHAVGLVGNSWEQFAGEEAAEAKAFVLRAAGLSDITQIDDVFEEVFRAESMLEEIGKDLATATYARIQGTGMPLLIKSILLENLVRLAANGHFGPVRATGALLTHCSSVDFPADAEHEGHEESGRRLVRALGLAAQYLGDRSGELTDALQDFARLHDEVLDDAAFELGQAQIRCAVAAEGRAEALERLSGAAHWFEVAESAAEYRPDAALLGASLRHVNSFCTGGTVAFADVEQVRSLAWSYLEGGVDEEPDWLTRRTESMLAWWQLVDALEKCSEIDDVAWYQPPALIGALGRAVEIQRGIGWYYGEPERSTVPSDLPVMERITSPFVEVAERRAWVDRWLKDAQESQTLAVAGVSAIREALRGEPEGLDGGGKAPGRPRWTDCGTPYAWTTRRPLR